MSSVARRSLLTATASGALLGALWFVPSAHSAPAGERPASTELARTGKVADSAPAPAAGGTSVTQATHPRTATGVTGATESDRLADTGGVDTTPYLVGGLASLGIGAGFVLHSARRSRAL
ncbi:hypothetical protein AB0J21_28000 [Streptomyces sp. NPDC049954]|uniref:hypothetical protein n=1 Tax=Streptomyces sp. NPDC049954 TaxID=3155779 RepID=UPI0034441F02